jgi:hypothetical protein
MSGRILWGDELGEKDFGQMGEGVERGQVRGEEGDQVQSILLHSQRSMAAAAHAAAAVITIVMGVAGA